MRCDSNGLGLLFWQAAVGIAQTDLTGRFLRVNSWYCALVGRSQEELLQLRMQDITDPDDLPGNVSLFERLGKTGEPFEIEKRYRRPDGSIVWVRNSVSCVRDSSGEPQSALGVAIDITRRKQAEAAMAESEARKRAILNAALDCIISIDQDSRVIEWNPAAERTFGYPAARAIGQDLAQLIIPSGLRERHYRGMAHYLETGEGPVLGRRVELEALREDGSRFPVELAISPIELGGQRHFTAYVRDITEAKENEAALRESEQRLRSTYEHAFAGIAEVDHEGRYLRVNEQFTAVTGYTREELLTRTVFDITHPDDRASDFDKFEKLMSGQLPAYTFEKRYIHKRGHTVWIELAASRVDDANGRPLYGLRVVRDISERKRAEENSILLIHELNHRVKNTLATVQSIAFHSLRSASSSDEARRLLEQRLLALSRAHDVLTRENWEGAQILEIIGEAVEPYCGTRTGCVSTSGPDIRISPRLALALSMIIQELATNAAKYGALSAADGRVEISWVLEFGASLVHITWAEAGGPPVTRPTPRGFGTRLIERSVGSELGGSFKIDFAPGGVVCEIDLPLGSPPTLSHEVPLSRWQ